MVQFEDVLTFWFEELTPEDWFAGTPVMDELVRSRFYECHEAAARGECYGWRTSPQGRLAEIIVLDQFSRNIHRGTPLAFASDSAALILAQELVLQKLDEKLTVPQRAFAYMPYMHSESPLIHDEAMRLFSLPGLEENLRYEILHKEIVDRFGRYPHRNKILGRTSSPDEVEFLKTHSGF